MEEVFSNTNKILKDYANIQDSFSYYIKDYINPIEINQNSTVGEQIKYYRQLIGIQQKDVANYVEIDRYTMYQIENYDYAQIYYPEHIRKIIEFLEIEDKIIWNDKYLEFIINKQNYKIKEFRIKYNLTQRELADLMGKNIATTTIRNWENGKCNMSRRMFDRFIDAINLMENKECDCIYKEYLAFIENNPSLKIKEYIEKEGISTKEFAERMDRNINIINNLINSRAIMTKKQYIRFKELLDNQEKGIISSDPYINFIKSNPAEVILNFLRDENLSRAELGRELGLSGGTVERWTRNEATISRNNYTKLIEFMDKKKSGTNA